MKKNEFLEALRGGLSGVPQSDIDERLAFYAELIDDRIEDGTSEEDAVAEFGNIDDIISQIMSDIPLSHIVKEKVKKRRRLRAWEIVLLILGAPVWLPIVITVAVVFLVLYVLFWAVAVVCTYVVDMALFVCGAAGLIGAFIYIYLGNIGGAGCAIGAAMLCVGLGILLFMACTSVVRGAAKLTKRFWLWVKSKLVGGEKE